jgi:exoribonuclease R
MMLTLHVRLFCTLSPFCRIQTRQGVQLMDKRLVVAIDGWDTDSMYPSGHYVRTLGVIGDRDVETVSRRCDAPAGFASAVFLLLHFC